MSLRERLRALRPAATNRSEPLVMPTSPAPAAEHPIRFGRDITLGRLETTAGPVLCSEHSYPLHYRHGRLSLDALLHVPGHAWNRLLPVVKQFPMEDAVFVDLETTGLSRGTGTYAFLIGVGRFTQDRFRLRQFFLRDFHEERAVLTALVGELEHARALVTFNGRGFDWPLLETRATMNRIRLPRLPHLDLLHPARRLWRATMDRCRLSRLEEEVLHLHRKDDVPGAEIPQLYFTFLETGDAEPLTDVMTHNRLDILSMAALAGYIGQAVTSPLTAAPAGQPLSGGELFSIGKLLLETAQNRSSKDEAIACLVESLNRRLSAELRRRCHQLLVKAYKQIDRTDEATAVLRAAVEVDGLSPWAYIELAKLYEHRVGDFETARDWSVRALELALRRRTLGGLRSGPPRPENESGFQGSRKRSDDNDVDAIVHRLRRLERRLRRRPEARSL